MTRTTVEQECREKESHQTMACTRSPRSRPLFEMRSGFLAPAPANFYFEPPEGRAFPNLVVFVQDHSPLSFPRHLIAAILCFQHERYAISCHEHAYNLIDKRPSFLSYPDYTWHGLSDLYTCRSFSFCRAAVCHSPQPS